MLEICGRLLVGWIVGFRRGKRGFRERFELEVRRGSIYSGESNWTKYAAGDIIPKNSPAPLSTDSNLESGQLSLLFGENCLEG